jgi:hypothetical protein
VSGVCLLRPACFCICLLGCYLSNCSVIQPSSCTCTEWCQQLLPACTLHVPKQVLVQQLVSATSDTLECTGINSCMPALCCSHSTSHILIYMLCSHLHVVNPCGVLPVPRCREWVSNGREVSSREVSLAEAKAIKGLRAVFGEVREHRGGGGCCLHCAGSEVLNTNGYAAGCSVVVLRC